MQEATTGSMIFCLLPLGQLIEGLGKVYDLLQGAGLVALWLVVNHVRILEHGGRGGKEDGGETLDQIHHVLDGFGALHDLPVHGGLDLRLE